MLPELEGKSSLELARFAAGTMAGGASRTTVAKLTGRSRRRIVQLLEEHCDDAFVSRDRQLADALDLERAGASVLQEAAATALELMRSAQASESAGIKEVASTILAAISSGHRLAELGARKARRYQAPDPVKSEGFNLNVFLTNVAQTIKENRDPLEGQKVLSQVVEVEALAVDGFG